MRITELNIIEFGAIRDKRLVLGEGLTVLEGQNESGKSTLVLFIKFMLYGLGRKAAKNHDRERSLSLEGHKAAGSMRVMCDEVEYLIERTATGRAKLTETLKITDLSTGKPLSGEAGELLLGVGAEVFESSAYVGQAKATAVGDGSAIENMLLSSHESIDVAKILERLDKVRKEYRLNRGEGGILFDTEREIFDLKEQYRVATQKQMELSEKQAKLNRLEKSIEAVTLSYTASKQMLDDVTKAELIKRFEELDAKKSELEGLQSERQALLDRSISTDFVPNRTHLSALDHAAKSYGEEQKKYIQRKYDYDSLPALDEELCRKADIGEKIETAGGKTAFCLDINTHAKKASGNRTAGLISLFLGLGAALAAYFALSASVSPIAAIGAGIGLAVAGAIAFVLLLTGSSKHTKLRDALCGEVGTSFDILDRFCEECTRALSERRSAHSAAAAAQALFFSARQDAATARQKLHTLLCKTVPRAEDDGELLTAAGDELARLEEFCRQNDHLQRQIYAVDMLASNIQRELSQYDRQELLSSVKTDLSTLTPEAIERAKTKERYDRERLAMLADDQKKTSDSLIALRAGLTRSPVELADKISSLQRKLDADKDYYDALMLAKEHIERASTSMSTNVTPDIAGRAGEMMAIVSGGAHSSLMTTKSLDLSLEKNGRILSSDLLSGGTKDAAYICLRIALMYRIYNEELPPLILDEAFCQLDDARTEKMLLLLSSLSSNIQCLIFTCHSREAQLCHDLSIPCQVLKM